METIHCFAPIADENSEMLILGSMPGGESLRKQQYYGFERNAFWRVIYALMDETFSDDYEQRKQFLKRNRIALWDVIKSCQRQGSLDSNIKHPIVNDFSSFFRKHPGVTRVFFNGKTAYNIFKRHVGLDFAITFTYLGSTSPAHAVAFEKRLDDWQKILK